MTVIVYSTTVCPYCVQAKQYLKKHNIEFTEINLEDVEARQKFYEEFGKGVRTVPQIIVDGERIGGYQELVKSDILTRKQAGVFGTEC